MTDRKCQDCDNKLENKRSKRCGLLTFEHQAGYGCFEIEKLR